MLVQFLVFVYH